MELIQNSVYNREGKKWKQRWAVLKKFAPNTQSSNASYYLFLYKDGVHAKEGKQKHDVSLVDFCGLDSLRQYDKAKNVLVIITATQTAFLSFENVQLRDQWVRILLDHFGEAVTYDISIPDKQKLKAGAATLRLYPSFFSIISGKNFRCQNRWYTNDILRYCAENENQFMFEIGPPNKSKGLLVNLVVCNAEAVSISKKFAEYDNNDASITPRDFHGSSLLDELGQAKRNANDQSFIRRAILRASDRMRKKIRDRSRTTPSSMKRSNRPGTSVSMSEEAKFRSIDRKTSPDIGVQINDDTLAQTIMLRSVSTPVKIPPAMNRQISIDEPAPQLPKKRSPNPSSSSQATIEKRPPSVNDEKSKCVTKERTLLKPRSKTTSDIPIMKAEVTVNSDSKPSTSKSEEQLGTQCESKNGKTDIQCQRKNGDSPVNNNINMPKQITNPAKYVMSKQKRPPLKSKGETQKTPTPPPRSPVSLGLSTQPSVFNFPPSNDVIEDTPDGQENKNKERKSSFLTEIDKEVKRRTMNSEDFSDDAFTYSSEASPASYHGYYGSQSESYIRNEPAYGNIDMLRRDSSDDSTSNSLAMREQPRRWRRGSTKHLSDPLGVEQWTAATGDGQPLKNLHEFAVDHHDYLNVKGTQNHNDDSDHDSYVNVSSSGPGKPELERSLGKRKKNIPEPLRLPSFKNDFEKYDDDDTNIYHPVGPMDNESSSSTGCISIRKGGGSFEDVNIKIKNNRNHSDYLNLMSPASKAPGYNNKSNSSKLNYVTIGSTGVLSGPFHSKSVSTSPVRLSSRSPSETYNHSDYTTIDNNRTAALNRSMVEHRQQVTKQQSGNKTPTKSAK